MRNTRERLHHLYGDGRQRFDLIPAAGGGTVASVVIPFDTDNGPPATFTTPSIAADDGVVQGVRRPASSAPAPAPVGAPATLRRAGS